MNFELVGCFGVFCVVQIYTNNITYSHGKSTFFWKSGVIPFLGGRRGGGVFFSCGGGACF